MRPPPNGYEIRPPTFDDVEGVAEVLLADDLADVGESDVDADFVRDQWSTPGVDLSEDAWVITDPNRTIVAHANLSPDGEGKVKSWGVVHPEHRARGLGAALLDRLEARATERLRRRASAVLHIGVTDTDTAAASLVRGSSTSGRSDTSRSTSTARRWIRASHRPVSRSAGSNPNATSAVSTRSSWRRSARSGATA